MRRLEKILRSLIPAKETGGSDKPMFLMVQVLRALAALMVVFGHAQNEAVQIAREAGEVFERHNYPWGAGVHLFFVISGFVIVYTSPKLAGSWSGVKVFIKRRFIRVVPIYWFYTSLMIAALFIAPSAIHSARPDLTHFLLSYLFVPHEAPGQDVIRPVLSLGWTLNYEIYFYAVFALLILWSHRTAIILLTLWFCLSVSFWPFIPEGWSAAQFWADPIVLEFLVGALIAYAKLRGTVLPAKSFWPLMVAAVIPLVCLVFTKPYDIYLLDLFLKGLAGTLFVMAATLPKGAENYKPPRVLSELGNSSYSLYLAHPFILGVLMLIWTRLPFLDDFNLWVYVGIAVIGCIVGAHILYLLIERPSLALMDRRKDKGQSSPGAEKNRP